MTMRETKRVVLLNDTSLHNHHGCRRVVATIRQCLAERGLQVVGSAPAGSDWANDRPFLGALEAADLIVINGEGTLHHATELGARLLAAVMHPARGDKPVALINTLYQDNPPQWADWLGRMSMISTRDRSSQSAIQALGLDADYAPDLSLYLDTFHAPAPSTGECVGYGDSVFPAIKRALRQAYRREARPRLYLPIHTGIRHPVASSLQRRLHNVRFKMRARLRHWRDRGHRVSDDVDGFIGDLRRTSIYLTGRYHGICLAMASGVPFRAIASNSHKIEALLQESGMRPERLARDVGDIASTRPEDWQFSAEESAALAAFLRDGRRRTDALFDRLADMARG